MNISAAISRAAMPDPHSVLGVTLRPFCIGHWLLMQRCNVSFVTGGSHALGDLLLGILICSGTYEGFSESLKHGGIEQSMKRWQRSLSGGAVGAWKRAAMCRLYNLCNRYQALRAHRSKFLVSPQDYVGFDFRSACIEFQHYIESHGGGMYQVNEWCRPLTAHRQTPKDAKPSNVPELALLASAAQSELGWTRTESLNAPLPDVRWAWSMHGERRDWVRVVSMDELGEMKTDKQSADEFAARVGRGEVEL